MSEDDDRRYGLKPLPEFPPMTLEEARLRQMRFEADRRDWREDHPIVPAVVPPGKRHE